MKTCSRRWKDGRRRFKCIAEATETVNGKHLCYKHAQNTHRRIKEKLKKEK